VRGSAGPAGADPPEFASAIKLRGFFATPSYLRLWFAGGIGNAMRWLELLVAGIFAYEVTQSTVLVALVTVARSLPMFFIGAIAGVIGEALNRKRLLVMQLSVMAATSAMLCVLAVTAQVRVWHIAIGGIVAGLVWAMELAMRRRMIGEVVAPHQVAPAVALDSPRANHRSRYEYVPACQFRRQSKHYPISRSRLRTSSQREPILVVSSQYSSSLLLF
jgi:hypothetical protein